MNKSVEKIKEEIARLEKIMEKDHFGSLVDRAKYDKNYSRLKKLRRELKKMEEEEKSKK